MYLILVNSIVIIYIDMSCLSILHDRVARELDALSLTFELSKRLQLLGELCLIKPNLH